MHGGDVGCFLNIRSSQSLTTSRKDGGVAEEPHVDLCAWACTSVGSHREINCPMGMKLETLEGSFAAVSTPIFAIKY